MSRLADTVKSRKFTLMVSIPENAVEYALAAQAAGADAVKTHINLFHHASSSFFGGWQDEKDALRKILEECEIPFGIVPGDEIYVSRDEMIEMRDEGFDFWDLYYHNIPDWLFEFEGMGKIAAMAPGDDAVKLKEIESSGVQIIESSVFNKDTYGMPLEEKDIEKVSRLISDARLPVMISTQRGILPEQVSDLKDAGLSGIIIGAVVTGKTAEGVARITGEFRKAIDRL